MQGGQLHLAKDEGVYLMPATGAWQGNDPVPRIAYAAGCHPQKNEDWYDTARLLAGCDDFIESLTIPTGLVWSAPAMNLMSQLPGSGSASILNAPSPAICWPSYLRGWQQS